MRVLALPVDAGACGSYRCYQPLQMIEQHTKHDAHVVDNRKDDPLAVLQALILSDILLVRQGAEVGIPMLQKEIVEYGKQLGKAFDLKAKIVIDIDDNVEAISPYSQHYKEYGTKEYYSENNKVWIHKDGVDDFSVVRNQRRLQSLLDAMKKADLITVTTDKLGEYAEQYNKKVAVLPNVLDLTKWWPIDHKPNKRLRIGWAGGSCVDDKTEILTSEGFKYFKDLKDDEVVATLSKTGELEYQQITEKIAEPFDGELHVVENNHVDFAVTPNHKLYVAKRTVGDQKKELEYKLVRSSEMYGKPFYVKRNAHWNGIYVDRVTIPGVRTSYTDNRQEKIAPEIEMKMDDWLKFFGFWLAEGWTTKTTYNGWKKRPYKLMQVGICQTKPNSTLKELKDMMEGYGIKAHYTKDKKQVRFCSKQLWLLLERYGGADSKYIPDEIMHLGPDQLKILLEWYIKGDGHVDGTGRIRSWTTSKKLADQLVEIALKIGWTATIKNRGKRSVAIKGRTITGLFDCYQISFIQDGTKYNFLRPFVASAKQRKERYKGMVYCVTVPNHVIYIRRNGKCHWTGNSHYEDIYSIKEPLNAILRKHDVEFYSIGVHFGALFDEDVKHKVKFLPWVPYPAHSYRLMALCLDIGIIPLADTPFNPYKSSIKLLEYSAMEIPSVCANVTPYKEDFTPGINALGYQTPEQFYMGLEALILSDELRKKIGNMARKAVEANHDARKLTHKWVDAYSNILKP